MSAKWWGLLAVALWFAPELLGAFHEITAPIGVIVYIGGIIRVVLGPPLDWSTPIGVRTLPL